MSKKLKTGILMGLISGLAFAFLMALFQQYKEGEPFDLFKFLFHFVFVGLFQGFVFGRNPKAKEER